MNIFSVFAESLANPKILSSITSTVFIILLGFFLRKKGIFTDDFGKVLSKVVLTVAIPALAFMSFMVPLHSEDLKEGVNVLIWGFLVYIIFIFVAPLLYPKQTKDKREVMGILTTFGSTTFFGIPIVGAVFGAKGVLYSSIFNIGYRVFLYSYAYIKMSGLKMEMANIKKMFLNPIVIATFLGLFLWLIQGWGLIPHVTVPLMKDGVAVPGKLANVAFFRIDETAIWLAQPLNFLAKLSSPLAWLSIGITLGSIPLKTAASNKLSWYYSWNKCVVVPLFNLLVLLALGVFHILPMSGIAIGTIVIMMATPTATVASAYAISFNRDAVLASNASFLSTIVSVILMPVWIAILQILQTVGIFH